MENYQDLVDLFSDDNYEINHLMARTTQTCIMCKNPAKIFRDVSAKLEYHISALCQICQDRFFRGVSGQASGRGYVGKSSGGRQGP